MYFDTSDDQEGTHHTKAWSQCLSRHIIERQDVTKYVVGMNETWGKLTTKGESYVQCKPLQYTSGQMTTSLGTTNNSTAWAFSHHSSRRSFHKNSKFDILEEQRNSNWSSEPKLSRRERNSWVTRVQVHWTKPLVYCKDLHCTYNLHCTNNDKGTTNHFCCMTNELSHSTPQTSAGWLWSKAPAIIFTWPMSFPTQY